MEEHKRYKYSYARGNRRWRSPRYGYTSYNHIDRDTANEKNSVADNRQCKENEGTQGSSSTYTYRG
jgi:hypothetical protein